MSIARRTPVHAGPPSRPALREPRATAFAQPQALFARSYSRALHPLLLAGKDTVVRIPLASILVKRTNRAMICIKDGDEGRSAAAVVKGPNLRTLAFRPVKTGNHAGTDAREIRRAPTGTDRCRRLQNTKVSKIGTVERSYVESRFPSACCGSIHWHTTGPREAIGIFRPLGRPVYLAVAQNPCHLE